MVKNMICNAANDCAFRRLRKILYVDKIVDFNFDSCSVLKKLEATQCFTTVIAIAYKDLRRGLLNIVVNRPTRFV